MNWQPGIRFRGEVIQIDKVFIWRALVAVSMTYSGIIIGGYSEKKIWSAVSKAGQAIGAVGLFAILFYLGIK